MELILNLIAWNKKLYKKGCIKLSKEVGSLSFGVLICIILVGMFTVGCGGGVDETITEEKFPEKPIEFVIHSDPGGGMDRTSRFVGSFLAEALGGSATFNNLPGASGEIATRHVLRQPKDGYTIYPMNPATIGFLTGLSDPLDGQDFNDVFDWIGTFALDPAVLLSTNFNTFEEFVEHSIESHVTIAVANLTMPGTLVAYQLNEMTDMNITVVPYDGSPPAQTDLLGGHVDGLIMMAAASQGIADQVNYLAMFQDENSVPNLSNNCPVARDVLREMGILAEGVDIINVASPRALVISSEVRKNYPERYEMIMDAYNSIIMSPEWIERGIELGMEGTLVNLDPERSARDFAAIQDTVRQYKHFFQ